MSGPTLLAAAQELSATDPIRALSAFDDIVRGHTLDAELRAQASYASARCALQSGQPADALDRIVTARELFTEAHQTLSALRTDLGRVNVLDDLGRHREASHVGQCLIEALEQAEISDDEAELRDWLYAAALENQGASMGCLGQHDAAARLLARSTVAYEKVGAPEDRARVRANLGVEQLELGKLEQALELLNDAERELADGGQADLARRCSVYAAQAEALAGRYGQALDRLPSALSAEIADSHDIDEIRMQIARAEVYCVMHLWPEVVEMAEQLEVVTQSAEMHRDLAGVWVLLARAHLGQGHTDEAATVARQAIALLDNLGLPARAARARLELAQALRASEALSEIRTALREFDSAGESWGVAAASVLGAELASSEDDRRIWTSLAIETEATLYPELAWRLECVRGQVARANNQLDDAALHFSAALSGLRSIRGTIEGDMHRLPFMSDRRAPLEALVAMALEAGNLPEARRFSASERAWLNQDVSYSEDPEPGTVMFQSIGGQLSAFVTGVDGTSHVELDATVEDLALARRRLQAQWRRIADPRMRVHLDQLRPAAESLLQDLYLRLLAPVEQLLPAELPLTIIPVGSMSGIPFHALHDGMSYLIERRALYLAPSDQRVVPNELGRTLVVGVPDKLAPEIEDEAIQIADITGGTLLLGSDATSDSLRRSLGDHDVLHLACHGRFRSENASMSALQLADGWFTAEAIAQLNLADKLVVLASCSSGLQRSMGEDESLGLPRAILAAGANAVVMNLWPADDLASVGMMTHFHSNLKTLDPSSALRAAQLVTMQTHPHPLLWGAPVVYGFPSQRKSDERTCA